MKGFNHISIDSVLLSFGSLSRGGSYLLGNNIIISKRLRERKIADGGLERERERELDF